ncbi:hypothetical protein M0805_008014 [Coniferiporia weirii]|nr:hypothetical protein M0805_008014 [Coniferiporia weirii]
MASLDVHPEITSASGPGPLKVGVLLCGNVQLLDAAAVDLFTMMTPWYLRACQLPDSIVALGRDVKFHYIKDVETDSAADGKAHALLTADMQVRTTDTLSSVGELDCLLIPGPEPAYAPSAPTSAFLRARVAAGCTLLVVCTGVLPVTYSGVLAGRRATAPLAVLPMLRARAPDVTWTELRWEVDTNETGSIWTSGGITNGLDMVAAYLRATFPSVLAELVCSLADVGDRPQEYTTKPDLVLGGPQ